MRDAVYYLLLLTLISVIFVSDGAGRVRVHWDRYHYQDVDEDENGHD